VDFQSGTLCASVTSHNAQNCQYATTSAGSAASEPAIILA
jgi:hypothetical protein